MHNADAISHLLSDAELVGGDEHRHASIGLLAQDVLEHSGVLRVEPDHRLIEHDDLRRVHQRGDDGHALLGAVRQALDRLGQKLPEIKPLGQSPGLGLHRGVLHAEQLTVEAEKLGRRQLVVKERKVRHVGQAAAGLERVRAGVEPANPHRAARRLH